MGLVIAEVIYGGGRHLAYLDPETAKMGLKLNFIFEPIYIWAITVVKISIAIFLTRITPTKFYKILLWSVTGVLVAYTAVCFIAMLNECKNLAYLWDSTVVTTCWSPESPVIMGEINAGGFPSLDSSNPLLIAGYIALNILTDLLFAFLPIPMLWHVHIDLRTKATLICIMGLGVL
jgi:hypothetical protein